MDIHKLIHRYQNMTLLDKVDGWFELPEDTKDWFLFEQSLNEKYIKRLIKYYYGS